MKRIALVLLITFVLLATLHYASASDITRSFSKTDIYYNEEITVGMDVDVTEDRYHYIIDEIYPSGWTVTDRGGGVTNESGHIKWVQTSNTTFAKDTVYYYKVRAPAVPGYHYFSGAFIFENGTIERVTLGETQVNVFNPCVDSDGDNYDNCIASDPWGDGRQIDCDDSNPNINPGEEESCNSIDDNCDGTIDQHTQPCGTDVGQCTIGWQRCTLSVWGQCNDFQDYDTEICNYDELSDDDDDDCNGVVNDVNGGNSVETTSCRCFGAGTPLSSEICFNNIDDNCDSNIDEGCYCTPGTTQPCTEQDGVCAGSLESCPADGIWDGCTAANYPATYQATETTCDDLDNDCDGETDEGLINTYYGDVDGDGYGDSTNSTQACSAPGYVTDAEDCDDRNSSISPDATEVCNTVDDNCDGNVDEGCPVIAGIFNTYYDGATSDFNAVSDFSDIQNMVMEKAQYGKIVFNEIINVSYGISIDPPSTIISANRVMINITRLPMLNKSADISLYGITLNNPTILRDGSECSSSICTFIGYANDVFEFNVSRFSEYSAQGRCDDGTWYGQCVDQRTGSDSDRPDYCDNGAIVDKASVCGCPSDLIVSGESCTSPPPPPSPEDPGDPGPLGCLEGATNPCNPFATTAGMCQAGVQTCISGSWSSCEGAVGPSDEICDNKDNDCDGETDEGLECNCFHGDVRGCGSGVGVCVEGTSTCEFGDWGECEGGVQAKVVENCSNELDDDCDGEINNECGAVGLTCYNGFQDSNEEGIDCGGICPNTCQSFLPFDVSPNTSMLLIIAGLFLLFVIVLWNLWKMKRGY